MASIAIGPRVGAVQYSRIELTLVGIDDAPKGIVKYEYISRDQ
jgi:hypothetical protein